MIADNRKTPFAIAAFLIASGMLLSGCENPSNMEAEQKGYRGTGMEAVQNDEIEALKAALNQVPEPLYPPEPSDEGDMATDIYENIQVLGHLRAAEFDRLMAHITEWIAPEEGCGYCHNLDEGFQDDSVYTKHVARKMLQMTMNFNTNWESHVGNVGVTCYTCHRGKAVPDNMWFKAVPDRANKSVGYRAAQNKPTEDINFSSLPEDPFAPYLLDDRNIRVNSPTALPSGQAPEGGIKNTEYTYSLMVHMSQSLGVNCTYCHNSRAFAEWDQSPPARATAWFGIRMVREANNGYIVPITDQFPENRLGPTGDVGKVYCATCHAGVNKPLYGVPMVADYPELWGDRRFEMAEMNEEERKELVAQAMAEAALAHAKALHHDSSQTTVKPAADGSSGGGSVDD